MEIVLLNCDMFTNLIIYVTQRIYSYTSITNTRRAVCKKLNRPVVMVYSVFYFKNNMIRYKYFKKSNRTEQKKFEMHFYIIQIQIWYVIGSRAVLDYNKCCREFARNWPKCNKYSLIDNNTMTCKKIVYPVFDLNFCGDLVFFSLTRLIKYILPRKHGYWFLVRINGPKQIE